VASSGVPAASLWKYVTVCAGAATAAIASDAAQPERTKPLRARLSDSRMSCIASPYSPSSSRLMMGTSCSGAMSTVSVNAELLGAFDASPL
jgi:hypothetical protein